VSFNLLWDVAKEEDMKINVLATHAAIDVAVKPISLQDVRTGKIVVS
jgi:hypothetical protein